VPAIDCPGGPREILKGGELGTLLDVGEVQGLTEAILQVLEPPRVVAEADRANEREYEFEPFLDRHLDVLDLIPGCHAGQRLSKSSITNLILSCTQQEL
jgi:hypothetical protein